MWLVHKNKSNCLFWWWKEDGSRLYALWKARDESWVLCLRRSLWQATMHESKKKTILWMQSRVAPLWERPDVTRQAVLFKNIMERTTRSFVVLYDISGISKASKKFSEETPLICCLDDLQVAGSRDKMFRDSAFLFQKIPTKAHKSGRTLTSCGFIPKNTLWNVLWHTIWCSEWHG